MKELVSDATKEELKAQHPYWHYDRTDRNGTRYFYDYTCPKCGGRKVLPEYNHIDGGVCYKCNGSGTVEKPTVVKVYTKVHGAKLEENRRVRAEKKAEERLANAKAKRGEWLTKLGFGNEDGTYVIYRVKGETFSVKEELKALGCKFQPCVGWYSAQPLEGFETQRMVESQVVDMDEVYSIVWKSKREVEAEFEYEPSASEWVGEVGERIEKVFRFDFVHESEFTVAPGPWGTRTSFMYLMSDEEGNVYKWSTGSFHEKGEVLKMKGTVKAHAEYKGTKQTVVTRCSAVK